MIIDFKSSFISNHNLVVLDLEDQLYYHQTLAFKKDSEFVDLFNYHIKKLEETGILSTLKDNWIPKGQGASLQDRQSIQAITLGFENLFFPFMILLFGLATGMFLSITEKLFAVKQGSRF